MERMNAKAYKELRNIHTNIKIAIYLPVEPGPENTLTNKSKFSNAIATLKEVFDDVQMPKKEQRAIIDSLRSKLSLLKSSIPARGLAVFIFYSGEVKLYALEQSVAPALYYELPNLHLEPITHQLKTGAKYWVLTLSSKGCSLFWHNGHSLSPVKDATLETDMITTLGLDETQKELQTHPTNEGGGKGSEGFHGHGSFKDLKKSYLKDYFRHIDSHLKKHTRTKREPIVLVGVDYVQTLFKQVSKHHAVVPSRISEDPHKKSIDNLLSIVRPTVSEFQS
jgi:hypothetical protein